MTIRKPAKIASNKGAPALKPVKQCKIVPGARRQGGFEAVDYARQRFVTWAATAEDCAAKAVRHGYEVVA